MGVEKFLGLYIKKFHVDPVSGAIDYVFLEGFYVPVTVSDMWARRIMMYVKSRLFAHYDVEFVAGTEQQFEEKGFQRLENIEPLAEAGYCISIPYELDVISYAISDKLAKGEEREGRVR